MVGTFLIGYKKELID